MPTEALDIGQVEVVSRSWLFQRRWSPSKTAIPPRVARRKCLTLPIAKYADMPPIVIAFHYKNLDAMGGMICTYAGAKREPISDGRHKCIVRAEVFFINIAATARKPRAEAVA
jgi:hypothetical protein